MNIQWFYPPSSPLATSTYFAILIISVMRPYLSFARAVSGYVCGSDNGLLEQCNLDVEANSLNMFWNKWLGISKRKWRVNLEGEKTSWANLYNSEQESGTRKWLRCLPGIWWGEKIELLSLKKFLGSLFVVVQTLQSQSCRCNLTLLCSRLNRCTVFIPQQLTLKDTRSLPVQVDGEPWEEGPCVITITHHNQALMLGKGEKQLLSWLFQVPRKILQLYKPYQACLGSLRNYDGDAEDNVD